MEHDEETTSPEFRPDEAADAKEPQSAESTVAEAVEVEDGGEDFGTDSASNLSPDASGLDGSALNISLPEESAARERQAPALNYPVAAFGASAGGLQAFREVLENLNSRTGMAFVLVDIDELRRNQQSLVHARDFARSVVENVPVPVVVLGPDFTVRTVNTAFRDLTEMPAKDLDNRSLPELMAHLWGIDNLREKLEQLPQSENGAALEFEHQSTTPRKKTLLIKALGLSSDGSRVYLLMIEDITLRREAENLSATQKEALEGEVAVAARKLNRTQEELRGLTGHLFTSQEEERQHVARELHDDIGQRLSHLEMLLHEVQPDPADKKNLERMDHARRQLQSLNTDVRQISHRLHPAILQDLGLPAALKAMVQEFGKREKMPATYASRDLPESWSAHTATAIYRIAQEALRNVSKHAGKTHVKVELAGLDGQLQLRVMDFGIGFDQDPDNPPQGLGMISMQERARLAGGDLEVKSELGRGTTVIATIPVERHA